jgi:hypothetical protein
VDAHGELPTTMLSRVLTGCVLTGCVLTDRGDSLHGGQRGRTREASLRLSPAHHLQRIISSAHVSGSHPRIVSGGMSESVPATVQRNHLNTPVLLYSTPVLHGASASLRCTARQRPCAARRASVPVLHGASASLRCTARQHPCAARRVSSPVLHGAPETGWRAGGRIGCRGHLQ